MTPTSPETRENERSANLSRRIAWLTLLLGLLAALAVSFAKSPRAGLGIAVGTFLAWLNFRWLDQTLAALVTVSAAKQGTPQSRVPARIYWKFAGRYVLMGLAIYVTVHYFAVPLLTVILGLLALGAGAIVGSLYEVYLGSE
jgi:ATP synthase I chain